MNIGERIREKRIELGLTQQDLALALGYKNRATIARIEKGERELATSKLKCCADILHTTIDQLANENDAVSMQVISLNKDNIFQIPVFNSVSAGFGSYASNEIVGYEPVYIDNPMEANETMLIRVSGNSMEPKIEDGDLIQVHKQTSVDSGDIAVILIEETEGVVKRVFYGSTWIELHSLNPDYPIRRFDGRDVLCLRILGKVKKIIKTL